MRTAANGRRTRRPLRRPVVSSTIKPPGTRCGEPQPARTRGSTSRLSMRKNWTSTEGAALIDQSPFAAVSFLDAGEEGADALRVGADVALPVARFGTHVDDAMAVGVAHDDDEVVLEPEQAAGVVAFHRALVLVLPR